MRVLVTGRGSIAQRHARHLRALVPNLNLAVVSSTGDVDASFLPCTVFSNMQAALTWQPDSVVIASISSKHAEELQTCLALQLPCLVEKPIAINSEQLLQIKNVVQEQSTPGAVVVGCNLRYLPALQKLQSAMSSLDQPRVLRAYLQVGQALSQWRPKRDLTTTYSADAASGGGVVFDLVHEIDMARWLLGPLQVHAAIGGHFSALPVQSDDVHVALLRTLSGAPVVVSLDYVSQRVVRNYSIVTDSGTFSVDIMGNCVVLHTEKTRHVVTEFAEDFDLQKTYAAQMADWLAAAADPTHQVLSPLAEGIKTAELMLDMKKAAA